MQVTRQTWILIPLRPLRVNLPLYVENTCFQPNQMVLVVRATWFNIPSIIVCEARERAFYVPQENTD